MNNYVSVKNASDLAPTTLLATMRSWTKRQRWAAVIGAVVVAIGIGIPTDVIPNPIFGRPVPVTWWSYPVLVVTAVLAGMLIATYVRVGSAETESSSTEIEIDGPSRQGSIGGLLSFFAVGCPVCNKLVVVALGTTGARQWFEPLQPLLAVASIVLLAYALRARIRSGANCSLPKAKLLDKY